MSLTGQQLLVGFSKFIGDYESSTTTSAGSAGGTTLVDTYLGQYADDYITDYYLRPTGATNQYAVRKISAFVNSTSTCTVAPAFGTQTASGQAYEIHKYNPVDKYQALDDARLSVMGDLFILRINDTITADGRSNSFDIPSALRTGPIQVIEEVPMGTGESWNFLTNPEGNSTTGWTASSVTASIVTRDGSDLLIPKYGNAAMKGVVAGSTAGTITQVVADMSNTVTAAKAAGRQVTFGAWVYTRLASKIQLNILTDAGTLASSTQHGGSGWELLTATGVVAHNNATTLSVQIAADNDSNPVVFYWNRAWFFYGEDDRLTNIYPMARVSTVRRDDTTQKFYLDYIPQQGHQLRLIGKDTLSALSGSASATMELDEESAQLLYAEAAKLLFARRGLTTNNYPDVAIRIALAEAWRLEYRKKFKYPSPQPQIINGPWSS